MTNDADKDKDPLETLSRKIAEAENKESQFNHPNLGGTGKVTQVMIEFIAPIVVGGAIGIWLDKYFSLMPLFTLIFILIGLGTGIMNVLRLSKESPEE
jgi:F0F1-type ATP synthase assembly protein I